MDNYGTKSAAWCEEFLNHLNLGAEVCDADGVPTHMPGKIMREVAVHGNLRFVGAWTDEQVDGAVEQGDLMLVISIAGRSPRDHYRVTVQRRHIVDVLLSRYQDAGARTHGKGVVQASETFQSAQDAADWVRGHNNELLELMRTMPAEAEEFKALTDKAKELYLPTEVIRNIDNLQVRINFKDAQSAHEFLFFLWDSNK